MRQSETDMTEHIFSATEQLMAKEGLNNLSMHKLAKEAQVSVGTIYLYFKTKEELLEQFARQIFTRFKHTIEKDYDENESFFEQYQRMWWNLWNFMQENPSVVSNMHQYEALPNFVECCKEFDQSHWAIFCKKAQQAGVLCDLHHNILFALGLETAIKLAFKMYILKQQIANEILKDVIERSWRSIQK